MKRRRFLKRAGAATSGLILGSNNVSASEGEDLNLWDFDFELIYDDDVEPTYEGMEFQEYNDSNDKPDVDITIQASEIYDKLGLDKEDEDFWTLAAYRKAEEETESLSKIAGQFIEDISELTRYMNGVFDQEINSVGLDIEGRHNSELATRITDEIYRRVRDGEIDTEAFYENNTGISTQTEEIENQILLDENSDPLTYSNDGEEYTIELEYAGDDEAFVNLNGELVSVDEGEDIVEGLELVDANPSSVSTSHARIESEDFENEFDDHL